MGLCGQGDTQQKNVRGKSIVYAMVARADNSFTDILKSGSDDASSGSAAGLYMVDAT